MKKVLSLILCLVLSCMCMNICVLANDEQYSTLQTYEDVVITAKSGEITSIYNHTSDGNKSVKLTSAGYKENYQLPQVLITDSTGDLISAKTNETYIFTAYIYSEKSGGDDVKFKILNTNTSLSYASGDLVYEKKGVTLEENKWTKISFVFTTGNTLSKDYLSYGITANKENTDGYTDTDVYYIDDVSLILLSELNSSIVSSPNKVGLYHNKSTNSAIYESNGTEYSSFRVYGEYQSLSNSTDELDYLGTQLTIEERGILVTNSDRADSEFLLDATGVRKGCTTGEGLSTYWNYNHSTGKVTYSVILGDISYANKDLSFAIRPYLKLSLDNETIVVYGDVQRGKSNNGFSLQSIYDSAKSNLGNPTWFDSSLAPTEISLYKDGLTSRYTIVRPNKMSNEMLKSTLDFYSELNETFDGGIAIKTDAEVTSEYEILIGETGRSESKSAYSELANRSDADYIIRMSGNKIVIAAKNAYALERALNEFKNSSITARKTVSKSLNSGYTCSPVVLKTTPDGNTIAPNADSANNFSIHTAEYPSYFTMEAARSLADYIQHKTGATLNIVKDGVTTAERSFYICSPEESSLTKEQYAVTVTNESIIKVDAGSEEALFTAISALAGALNSETGLSDEIIGDISKNANNLPNNYSLSWNDEFDGTTLDRDKWNPMTDTTEGPWYRTYDSYYIASKDSAQWLTGNYIVASFTDNTVSITYDTSKADMNTVGDDKIFFDNITSTYVSSLTEIITAAGGKILISGTVESWYAQEGIQTRPSAEGKDETYYVSDGVLYEITSKSDSGYDAVRIATDKTMTYRYGMTEVRMVAATNNGACSAVWTSGKNTNEIDVYENYGEDLFRANLHTFQPHHKEYIGTEYMDLLEVKPKAGQHFYDTYHYIGYEWTDTYIAFYLDGDITQIVDITDSTFDCLRENTALRLANGVGLKKYSVGNNPGNKLGNNTVNFSEEQKIDYVRIYQKQDSLSKMELK